MREDRGGGTLRARAARPRGAAPAGGHGPKQKRALKALES